MDDNSIHHYTFQGVDTSHFRIPQQGDVKVVNGVRYVYVQIGDRLRLMLDREESYECNQRGPDRV